MDSQDKSLSKLPAALQPQPGQLPGDSPGPRARVAETESFRGALCPGKPCCPQVKITLPSWLQPSPRGLQGHPSVHCPPQRLNRLTPEPGGHTPHPAHLFLLPRVPAHLTTASASHTPNSTHRNQSHGTPKAALLPEAQTPPPAASRHTANLSVSPGSSLSFTPSSLPPLSASQLHPWEPPKGFLLVGEPPAEDSDTTAPKLAIAPYCQWSSPGASQPFVGPRAISQPYLSSTNPADHPPPSKLPITHAPHASAAPSAPQGSSGSSFPPQVGHASPCILVPCQLGQKPCPRWRTGHGPCTAMGSGGLST